MTDKGNTRAGSVRLTGCLICRSAGDIALLETHLPDHLRLTRAEPGCLSFDVAPTEDPLVWRVEECFADRAAFEFHQQRTRASSWWAATADIPRAYQISGLE